MRIGVFADPGQTYNTTTTLEHLIATKPDVALMIGDFTYADNYLTYGVFGSERSQPTTCKLYDVHCLQQMSVSILECLTSK